MTILKDSLSRLRRTAGAIIFCSIIAAGLVSQAAPILWTDTIIDTTDGDASPGTGLGDAAVSTEGILVEAANFGTLADVTVNGVMFTGVDFDASLPANLTIGYDGADNLDGRTGTSTGGAIDALSTEFSRDNGVSFQSATLTGLTIGQNYQVQFLASFSGLGRTTTFDDGAGRSIVQRTNNPHSFSTGLFTADAATQTVNMTASTGSQFLTAYQLRAVNDPPVFPPLLTIDRDTGSIALSSQTATDILGYSIRSDIEALDQAGWTPITDNYDLTSGPGDGSVDPDDAWTILTASGSHADLSEAQLGGPGPEDGGTIPASAPIMLSSGGGWIQYHEEDVEMTILRPDGTSENLFVDFVGNNGAPFAKGDFDFDGDIDSDDHGIFAAGLHADLSSLSIIEAYTRGDLNEDLVSNVEDFLQFQVIYDDANGAGAFAALQAEAVPEPSSMLLFLTAAAFIARGAGRSRRFRMHSLCASRSCPHVSAGLIAVASLFVAEAAPAADVTWSEIIVDTTDGDFTPGTGLGDLAVSTNGTLIEAANFGILNDFTVNGVLFNGVDFDTSLLTNLSIGYDSADNIPTFGNGGTSTGGAIDDITASFGRDAGISSHDAMLTGLTIGQNYEVQFIASFANLNRTTTFDDGNGNTIVQSTNNPHSFSTGVFTADATTQAITMTASSGSQFISAYQLRQLDSNPLFLDLLYDPSNGLMKINNPTGDSVDINYYEITSSTDSLDPLGWNSLDDQDIGFGTEAGQSWTEAGGSDEGILSEFFTLGTTTLADQDELSLGKAFNVGDPQTLAFHYLKPGASALIEGTVTAGTITAAPGDANGDGVVDGKDLLVLQQTSVAQIPVWEANYGTVAVTATAAAIPEPSTLLLLIGTCSLALGRKRGQRRKQGQAKFIAPLPARRSRRLMVALVLLAAAAFAGAAHAAVTNDREYWFGEDSLEGPAQGAIIGGSNTPPLATGDSADSKGPSGAFLDLSRSGNPTYQDVDASGGLNRPGAGNGEFGARFDGAGDVLHGFPLYRPDHLDTLVGGGYPLNYSGITARGMQLWVYPDASALGSASTPTTLQSIVADSNRGGGPAINELGQWTQISGNRIDGSNGAAPVPASVNVPAGDTWYHVMHHNYPLSGDNVLAIVYVDGVAVSANVARIPTAVDAGYVPKLAVGAAEVPNDSVNAVYDFFFTGVVDDLEMYVFGDNSSQGGQDFGTFDLFSDNAWIAQESIDTVPGQVLQPGDVNKDGLVNGDGSGPVGSDDVSAFVAGWLSENELPAVNGTLLAGDWNTWDDGDMNHDGITDLDDAFILHQALKNAGGAGLNFALLGAAVPEPTSLALIAAAAAMTLPRRRPS